MSRRGPFYLRINGVVQEVFVHDTRIEAENAPQEGIDSFSQSRKEQYLRRLLDLAQRAAPSMGMTRGTLLLFIAVGALTQEEKEGSDIHTAVDFIIDGYAFFLGEHNIQDIFKK